MGEVKAGRGCRRSSVAAIWAAAFLVGSLSVGGSPGAATKRVALIIANSAYKHTSPLKNPANDGKLMAETLTGLGFEASVVIDGTREEMRAAMRDFGRKLRASDAVGLFYYAGHAVQLRDRNYLIPIDANITDITEVSFEAVRLSDFLATMERSDSRVNIVILDACRNNPFPAKTRSVSRGLARVTAPTGTFIAYATAPGEVAADGEVDNSPYARSLARALVKPGLTIEQVFKLTRRQVLKVTGGKQTPWETSSMTGDFYFLRSGSSAASAGGAGDKPAGTGSVELAFWNSVRKSDNLALYRAYLETYPNGAFVNLAKLRIGELSRKATSSTPKGPGPGKGARVAVSVTPPIFPDSSKQIIRFQDIRKLSCEGLWRARNEIYARNGFCFTSARALKVFDNSACTTKNRPRMSPIEHINVRRIRTLEIRKNCR